MANVIGYIVLLIVVLVGLLSANGIGWQERPVSSTAPLRLAINEWPGAAHAFVAEEQGLFNRHGLSVQLVLFKELAKAVAAYRDKEVDGVFGVFSDAIILHAEGYPTKVVAITDYSSAGDVIIGHPALTSLADLKGRTVSFENLHSFSHIFVLKALASQGLDERDTRFAMVPAMGVLAALESGGIDAGHTWQPVSSQALAKGYRILAKAGDFPGIITDVLFLNANLVTTRPQEVQAVVSALFEAKTFLATQQNTALAIMARRTGMTMEEMAAGLGEIVSLDATANRQAFTKQEAPFALHTSGAFIVQFLLQRGELPYVPPLDDLLESRFVQAVP